MDEEVFYQYVTRYYHAPDPLVAAEALQWFASSQYAFDPNVRGPMKYFFGRLLELHPEQRDAVSRARLRVPPNQPPVIDEVLAATEPPNRITNAVDMPATAPQVNDLLWSEFSLTGKRQPVERLIAIINQPDLVRERLETWLKSRGMVRSLLGPVRRWKRTRLQVELGIDIDPDRLTLRTPADLDCRCFLEGLEIDRFRAQRARAILPFRLSTEDQVYIAVKATAKWSLAARVRDERDVRVICEDLIDRHNGSIQLALIEIVAVACAAQQENDSALELAARYLSLDPDYDLMVCLKAEVGSRIELDALMGLPTPVRRVPLGDTAGIVGLCINATENASSYRARCIVRSTEAPGEESRIVWNVEHSKPCRFHVTQEAHPSEDYDEWIAIGNHVWRQPFWIHMSGADLPTGEHHLDIVLSPAPYLHLLDKMPHSSAFSTEIAGRHLGVLEYIVDANEEKVADLSADEKKKYEIWIDQETGLLLRVDVEPQNESAVSNRVCARHVFADYDGPIRIDAPLSAAKRISS